MMDRSSRLEGQDWQRWATQLLHLRYSPGDYQQVPDKKEGDAGIEGYSIDGRAYQMYGPEGELTFAQRHKKLRDKMTRDINKFINNKNKLCRLFGSLKIKRWILFVPSFDNREIVEHASKKTEEVLSADLPYVLKDDFKVVVIDEDAFAGERAYLLSNAVADILVQAEEVTEEEIKAWTEAECNSELVIMLDGKICRVPTLKSKDMRLRFRRDIVGYLLHGQNVLEALRTYPDIWASLRHVKSERERYLWTTCMASGLAAGTILQDAITQIKSEVKRKAPALDSSNTDAVAHEALADWLMRCPLDFPATTNDG